MDQRKKRRLNNSYWQDEKLKVQITKEMKEFFEINMNKEVETRVVWDAGKAYLRGMVIKYAAAKNKELKHIMKL